MEKKWGDYENRGGREGNRERVGKEKKNNRERNGEKGEKERENKNLRKVEFNTSQWLSGMDSVRKVVKQHTHMEWNLISP